MSSTSELVAVLSQVDRAALQKIVASLPAIPPMARAAAAGAIAFIPEADFNKYRALIIEVYGALEETDRGRAVLAELGIL